MTSREAEAIALLRALFGATKNEMVARGLPLEWTPESTMGRTDDFLRKFDNGPTLEQEVAEMREMWKRRKEEETIISPQVMRVWMESYQPPYRSDLIRADFNHVGCSEPSWWPSFMEKLRQWKPFFK